ncbi:DUF5994 family protein [Actinosynnema sp. CS-041913]|uniref:DUF5994 family protein n=1 Tax=Actinosynnema sp. CS-041913 TaxID=3239917 RepID=UPI003D9084B4
MSYSAKRETGLFLQPETGVPAVTSALHLLIVPSAASVTEQPRHPQRLRLRPKTPTTGHVNGAWWPRSQDLVAELPGRVRQFCRHVHDRLSSSRGASTALPTAADGVEHVFHPTRRV